jgi:chromosome segregation protein
MLLKQLKLAGFKSFVDPTVVSFPSQLVAVVGPNGCGKSNIIDAVRWVMGESSAKSLRGESMTDIIFNGSTNRKAVGQASVELVFDNSLGRLLGQYASYQEISVKRLVTRDGEVSYYLNGSRCRRRDIRDIFLGTGAGARGYSIIGQGTISQLVEARPEELRIYLEEAAGISKYKERRRETLQRIAHTRENLARVADIRSELDKQLQKLEHQAKTAERYTALKAEEHLYKAEILALKWQSLNEQQKAKQSNLQHLLLEHEKLKAHVAEIYQQSMGLREKHHEDNEAFQQVQANFYQLATEIARLEATLQQHQGEKQRLQTEEQQMQIEWQNTSSQLQQDKDTLQASKTLLDNLRSTEQTLQLQFNLHQQSVAENQKQLNSLNVQMQEVQAAYTKALGEARVEQVRLQHLNERCLQIKSRLEKIDGELMQLAGESVNDVLKTRQEALVGLRNEVQLAQDKYQQLLAEEVILRQQVNETEKSLHQAQDSVHHLYTQQAGLQALQNAALGLKSQQNANLRQWSDKPRLVEMLSVEKKWQSACELVLAYGLQAIILDSLDTLWPAINDLPAEARLFLTSSQTAENKAGYPRLSDQIKGFKPSWIYSLDKIYTASSLEEAYAYLTNLKEDESVITPEGYWLGIGWVKIAGTDRQNEAGLLVRQEELTILKEALALAQEELVVIKDKRNFLHSRLKEHEGLLETAKRSLSASRDNLRACEAEISYQERAWQQSKKRKDTLTEEREELSCNLQELASQQENAGQLCTSATQAAKRHEMERSQLSCEQTNCEKILLKSRQAVDEARMALHQCQLQADREKLKIQQLDNNLSRKQAQLEVLNERLTTLANRLSELAAPEAIHNTALAKKILQHSELDTELNRRREQINSLTKELESLEAVMLSEDKKANSLQEKILQGQIQEQALAVRAENTLEALAEFGEAVEVLLAKIPSGVTQDLREKELQYIVDKIKFLGAINLAAIAEYDSALQRKQYLDEQHQDLTTALATLAAAIEKIDKETRQRLRTTFDEVNYAFQALFPRLFGGGHAMLELTCDNLLEAGVLVMAQPPGKRNSTIHLLSGGEKAMTAVALVFAIFQLNPSPFCMLDEVDAPLDDMNVGRFCELVKEMSQLVQFLFITHNKITVMELADHIIGVTMHEPGVSQVVTVDIEKALSMSS